MKSLSVKLLSASRIARSLMWTATAFGLSHCATTPPQTPPVVALPGIWANQQPASSPASTHAAPASIENVPDLRQWWRAFADPILDDLIERALRGNLDVQQAALRIQAARALARESRAEFLPTLSARTYSTPNPDSTRSFFQAGFDATWELGLFGRARNQERAARATVEMAEVDAQAARVSVVAEVVRAYLQLRAEQTRRTLLLEVSDAQRSKLRLMQVRRRLQLISDLDLGNAQIEQVAADAASAEPLLGIEQSRQQLAILVGDSAPDPALDSLKSLPTLQATPASGLPADLLRTRPEIRHAEQTILKAAAALGIAKADLYPRLSLGGLLIASAPLTGISLGTPHSTAAIGPVIDIPLFDWGARRAVVSARDAELKATELAYRAAVLTGVGEVETALATLKLRRVQVDAALATVQALRHAEELTQTLRQQQLADDLDRNAIRMKLLRAQLELLQARQAQSLAYVALYKALGGAPQPSGDAPGKSTP